MPFGIPKHIYFETSAVEPWPISLEVAAFDRLIGQSQVLNIQLVIPDTVIAELQKHHVARSKEKSEGLNVALREARDYLVDDPVNNGGGISNFIIGSDDIQKKINVAFEGKGVVIISRPSLDINVIMDMSLKMHPPFDKHDKGFRDTVILLTILNYAKQSPNDPHWLIAADGDFASGSIKEMAHKVGVELEVVKSVQEAANRLENLLDDVVKKHVEYRRELFRKLLDVKRVDIASFITQRVGFMPSDLSPAVAAWSTVQSIDALEVKDFSSIQLGSVDPGPTKVSFEVEVELTVSYSYRIYAEPEFRVGESRNLLHGSGSELEAVLGGNGPREAVTQVPKKVVIEATVTSTKDGYGELQLENARYNESLGAILSRLYTR